MNEKSVFELLRNSDIPEKRKAELEAVFRGERYSDLWGDIVAKHIFSPDLHPERMDFILQHTMADPSLKVDKSAANEIYLRSIYSKKTILDIPAWLKDHRLADLEIQNIAQEFIFDRTDIYASNMLLLQYSVEEDQLKSELEYNTVNESIIIVLMVNSPKQFKEFTSNRYIHRITKSTADSGMEFNTLKKMVFVQLDKALELYMSHSYNEDEDVELLKLFAMIADVNRDWVREEASSNRFIADILDDVLTFTRDKEVQNMITVEELDRIHYHSNIMLAKREGRDEGRNEGHVDILSLYKWLHSQNRDSDFDKATDNPTYLDALLDEYNSSNET